MGEVGVAEGIWRHGVQGPKADESGDASSTGMETPSLAFPDSLCARILKAKYYLNNKLVDQAPAGEASQTWRAVEYGLELLKQGVVHRIGDRRSTQIWRDNWLPRGHGLKPIGPRRLCPLGAPPH